MNLTKKISNKRRKKNTMNFHLYFKNMQKQTILFRDAYICGKIIMYSKEVILIKLRIVIYL